MRRPPRLRAALGWVALAAALGAVFALYLQPGLALDLATRLWACF